MGPAPVHARTNQWVCVADSTTGARLERFDFKDPPNTAAFICQHVAAGDPILYVSHDEDGDWQFLCGRPHGEDAPQRAGLVCLADVVRRDPELNTLATLCSGHHVERTSAAAAWSITDDG